MTVYDAEQVLFAENMALGQRLQRLSPVLVSMARDLAALRREVTLLRRENDQLRAGHVVSGEKPAPRAGERRKRPRPQKGLLCSSCGQPVVRRDDGSSADP